jgi:ribulose-5-phosphate 4-epimerase/fuculose-1-phosphate aldolase
MHNTAMSDLSQLQIQSMRSRVSAEEWDTRVNLAACYRLVHHYGMDDLVYNHISARVPGEEGHFLINAYGMTYDEISASSLVKIDFDGKVVQDSGTGYGVNHAGFVIHSAIHRARADVACVIHTHTPAGMAVSAMRCGLLPLTQNAMFFSGVGYHDYEGPAVDLDEQRRLVADLGAHVAMVLRNHGLLAVGATIPEAFVTLYWLERACQAQALAVASNKELNLPGGETVLKTNQRYKPGQRRSIGELEWAGLLRLVERRYPGFRD